MKTLYVSGPLTSEREVISVVQTCSDNIPPAFLKSLDDLTTELASGTSNNNSFLSRSHVFLCRINFSVCGLIRGGVEGSSDRINSVRRQ